MSVLKPQFSGLRQFVLNTSDNQSRAETFVQFMKKPLLVCLPLIVCIQGTCHLLPVAGKVQSAQGYPVQGVGTKQRQASHGCKDPIPCPGHCWCIPSSATCSKLSSPLARKTVKTGAKALQEQWGSGWLLPHWSFWGAQGIGIASVFLPLSEIPPVLVK